MKKLLILTAVVILTAGTVGCCCRPFRRGALCPALAPGTAVYAPGAPSVPCDVSAPGTYTTTPVLPHPESVTPAP